MFNSISWSAYIQFILVASLVYYVIVLLIYYRKDMLHLAKEGFPGKKKLVTAIVNPVSIPTKEPVVSTDETNNNIMFSSVHDLLEEFKTLFPEAGQKKFIKEELIVAVQIALKKYSTIKGTVFQIAVNNQVVQHAKDYCGFELDQYDIKCIWE
ncbi:MAG: hypothetical protein QM726_04295 [Chitinophagaceae bacterium]